MNDNDNNILIAQQGNCDVALVNGTKILHYKDKNGNDRSINLANLADGTGLFNSNTNLNVDWEIPLPNLTNGTNMFFKCSSLLSFSGNLSKLTNGYTMFAGAGISSWTVELPNLTNGYNMFRNCSKLTSWNADLPKLSNGDYMFSGCKLDKAGVHRIAESIPVKPDDATSGYRLILGIAKALRDDADVAADLETIEVTKGWDLTREWN